MNPKRILLSLLAAFIVLSGTDYLIHEVWLKSTYALNVGTLWRDAAGMKDHMLGIFVGQFMVAIAFAMLWARISIGGAGIQCAIALGFFLGLAYSGAAVIQGAVQPLPSGLVTKWIISGIAQSILTGIVLFLVNKPAKGCPDISGICLSR